ncbi:MAG: amidohydrolase family protein [Planctomycetota bacterium]
MRPKRVREAHAHIHAHGLGLRTVDLSACSTRGDALARLGAAEPDERGWLIATGARPEAWTDSPAWFDADELHAAARGEPVAVWCFDYHAIQLSPAAMETLSFAADPPAVEGGRFVRDASGSLTGVLLEKAALLAWSQLDTGPVRPSVLAEAIADLAGAFAEVHDLRAQPELGSSLAGIAREAGVRCELYPLVEHLAGYVTGVDAWSNAHAELAGGKIFVDGTLNSRTALMTEPFADGPPEHPSGMAMMTPGEIESAIALCAEHGLRLAAHAIGDGAVRVVLDAVEAVRPPRWTVRIEHAEVIAASDVPRFAELGVIASVQPCHLLVDVEALGRALPDRLDRILPLRELIDAGLEPGRSLLFGSDTPIVRPDPEDSILAATERRRKGMAESEAIAAEQAITEAEAWSCFDADRPMKAIGED